jgi:prepilin-type N-terminal cleavage/methylation domain-containing protein/prepilin-type processing-associated H-X9-DG protein
MRTTDGGTIDMRRCRFSTGFSLVELLVVLVIVALLAALLLPTFAQARAKARQTTCISNLRQMAAAMHLYLQDYDNRFPFADGNGPLWSAQMSTFIADPGILRCPTCVVPGEVVFLAKKGYTPKGYAINSYLHMKDGSRDYEASDGAEVRFPTTTVVFCEVSFYRTASSDSVFTTAAYEPQVSVPRFESGASFYGGPGGLRHHHGSNYAFMDGHVKWHAPRDVWSAVRGNDGKHPSFGLK